MWMMLAVRWGSVGCLGHKAAPGVDSLHFPDKPAPVPPSDGPQGPGTGLEGQWTGVRSVPGARGTTSARPWEGPAHRTKNNTFY